MIDIYCGCKSDVIINWDAEYALFEVNSRVELPADKYHVLYTYEFVRKSCVPTEDAYDKFKKHRSGFADIARENRRNIRDPRVQYV